MKTSQSGPTIMFLFWKIMYLKKCHVTEAREGLAET